MVLPKIKKLAGLTRGLFFPFGIKLALIVTLILLGSIWTITTLMAMMVSSEFARTTGNSNFDMNVRAAAGVRERLYKIRSDAMFLLDLETAFGSNPGQVQQIRTMFFERNPNIADITVYGKQSILNQAFFTNNDISENGINTWLESQKETLDQGKKGVPVIKNVSSALGVNLLALFYPWQGSGTEEAAVIFFSPENLAEISGTGSSTTIVTNGDGDVLVHPNFSKVMENANIKDSPIAVALRNAPGESVRLDYTEGGSRFVGAGNRISFADTAVFSSVGYDLITEQITGVIRRNIYLSLTVLFLAILVTWFFSKTITNPLKRLSAASARVESGEFNPELKHGSRDEFGALISQFTKMCQGLIKWTDAKRLVGRYNSNDLFDSAIHGKLNLKGEYVKIVVLSVEFINFAEIASNTEAGEALELLNQFLTIITEQTEKNGGLVDKLMGSRLIAIWNIPTDAEATIVLMKCIRAVMQLRASFWELNTEREGLGQPQFRMGCGIQAGEVLAGRMGTAQDYQYTITGQIAEDAMEAGAACGPAGVDIIVTGTVKSLANQFIICEDPNPPQKRKSRKKKNSAAAAAEQPAPAELKLFGLVNLTPQGMEKPRWPFNLGDVRESLGKRKPLAKTEPPEKLPE
ncbi:MAG: HAMP domain-containing protein [Treponema sp.]|nr:HAMP domain-containing protein [Treponema sp.]